MATASPMDVVVTNPVDWGVQQPPQRTARVPAKARAAATPWFRNPTVLWTLIGVVTAAGVGTIVYDHTVGVSKRSDVSTASPAVPQAVHAHEFADATMTKAVALEPALSSSRLHRHTTTLTGSGSEHFLGGAMTSVHDVDGTETWQLHHDVVRGMGFGQFANQQGYVGNRTLRTTVTNMESGRTGYLVPFSFSSNTTGTLVPNFFYASIEPASGSGPLRKGFVNTVYDPPVVFGGDLTLQDWQAHFAPFTADFWEAAIAHNAEIDAASSSAARRELDIGSSVGGWAGGKAGGYIGNKVGTWAGGAAGAAIGTALGGPIGGAIGEDVGSYLGGKVGSWAGKEVGSDLGADAGGWAENELDGGSSGGSSNSGGGGGYSGGNSGGGGGGYSGGNSGGGGGGGYSGGNSGGGGGGYSGGNSGGGGGYSGGGSY